MAITGISGKSVACLLLYRMGRVDFAVDANVLRVMTRLGWLKAIGIYATEGLSINDRRAAVRAGAVLPLELSRHQLMALPNNHHLKLSVTRLKQRSSELRLQRTHKPIKLVLTVGSCGTVRASCDVIRPKTATPLLKVRHTATSSQSEPVRLKLTVANDASIRARFSLTTPTKGHRAAIKTGQSNPQSRKKNTH